MAEFEHHDKRGVSPARQIQKRVHDLSTVGRQRERLPMALIPFQLFSEAEKRNFDFVIMIHAHSRLHLDLGICRAVGVLYCLPGMA